MFGFRKKEPPPLLPGNSGGVGTEGKVAFSTGDRSWVENFNVVDLAATALKERGYAIRKEKTWLEHPDSGLILLPQLMGFEPLDDGGVRTVTTIQTHHPRLVPAGLFEFQHSAGDSMADAIGKGFDQWLQMDFVTFLEALRPRAEACTSMEMQFPATANRPARVRRAVLGPVAHYMQKPPPAASANEGEACEENHSFCPCCLLTKSFEAFQHLLEADEFLGLRLFAARDENGQAQADCRVNGEDFEAGAQSLRDYASTWPEAGYEFRKQYVVLQTLAGPSVDS